MGHHLVPTPPLQIQRKASDLEQPQLWTAPSSQILRRQAGALRMFVFVASLCLWESLHKPTFCSSFDLDFKDDQRRRMYAILTYQKNISES